MYKGACKEMARISIYFKKCIWYRKRTTKRTRKRMRSQYFRE
jgi:hypothetical protein